MGVALRTAAYRRGWLSTRRLNRPVVSVGNLSVGGTGKTPFVAFLADLLLKRGWKPGILTRGYGRRKGAKLVAIESGASRAPDPREVGDEPALLARKLPAVPIVVCADRYRAGILAEEKFGVDVHILDDGFQHLALARDVDIVLLDATKGVSDYALLPAGRMREPLSALGRAHFVVITRTELADPKPIEGQVLQINPQARIFRCATRLLSLKHVASGELVSLSAVRDKAVHAFCGIGNPEAFFANLESWGLSIAAKRTYRDHYRYIDNDDLVGVEHAMATEGRVRAFITTEKDALKLSKVKSPVLTIFACVIELWMTEARAFGDALIERLGTVKVSA